MAPGSPKLFEGSRHQTFQDAQFRTAGNDIHSHTYNIHFNAPGSLSSELPDSQTNTSVRKQSWSRMIQQVSSFFRSDDNRGALAHAAAEGEIAGPTQVQYSIGNAPSQGGREETVAKGLSSEHEQSEESSENSSDDYWVVSFHLCSFPV